MEQIPTDPRIMDQWPAPEPPAAHDYAIADMVDVLRTICPRRIAKPAHIRVYNTIWARLEGMTYDQIAAEQDCATSTIHSRIRQACQRAPALADILQRPRHRWVVGT